MNETKPEPETGDEPRSRTKRRPDPHPCGWCAPGFGRPPGCRDNPENPQCKGGYRDGVPASVSADRIWHCPCALGGHKGRGEGGFR